MSSRRPRCSRGSCARRPGELPHRPGRRPRRRRRQHLPVQGPQLLRRPRWGGSSRPPRTGGARATPIADGEGVDAAFVGRDGKTYVFSGDQFVTYSGVGRTPTPRSRGTPGRSRSTGAACTAVALAYVRDGITHLFEPPDAEREPPLRRYSGSDYTRPDPGYPQAVGPDFWGIPPDYRGAEPLPSAVLFDRDNTLYLTASQYVAHNAVVRRLVLPAAARAALARPAAGHRRQPAAQRVHRRRRRHVLLLPRPVHPLRRRRRSPRPSPSSGAGAGSTTPSPPASRATAVDAAFVWRGTTTYLFSGDQYVRYSGSDYRYVDAGYPKSVVADLRSRGVLPQPARGVRADAGRPDRGGRADGDRRRPGERPHRVPVRRRGPATSSPRAWRPATSWSGSAASATPSRTPAGWTRRSSGARTPSCSPATSTCATPAREYEYVDEGYPRRIAASLPGELGVDVLPEQFHDGLDAALADANGPGVPVPRSAVRVHRRARAGGAADRRDVGPGAQPVRLRPVRRTGSTRRSSPGDGSLFAFKGDQYLRYGTPTAELADDGYPRTIKDDWGNLPPDFEKNGLDAAFVFEGNTYFVQGDQHVRYSGGDFRRIDRTYPAAARRGGSAGGRTTCSPISAPSPGSSSCRTATTAWPRCWAPTVVTADPYARLAGLFGWDVDELMWVQRHHGFLPGAAGYEVAFDVELVEAAVELFALAAPLGGRPSTVFTDVWTPLYDPDATNVRAAADALLRLLALRYPEAEWATIERRLHDELNVVTRDALVAAVLGQSDDLSTSRDLFDRLLHRRGHGQRRHHLTGARGHRRRAAVPPPLPPRPAAGHAAARRRRSRRPGGGQGGAAALVGLDEELPAVGGQPEGLPVPGELHPARAARHQDTRLRRARGRPAAGRDHAGLGRARLPAIPGRVHRGVPADDRGRLRARGRGRRRPALASRAVRADEDRPSPVLLPPRRVLPRGQPLGRVASVAEGERPDRQRSGLPGLRLRPGLRVLADVEDVADATPTVSFTRHDGQRDALALRRVADHARRQDLLLVLQPQRGVGAGAGADRRVPDPGQPADLGRPVARRAVAGAGRVRSGRRRVRPGRGPRDHRRPVLVRRSRATRRRRGRPAPCNSARSCTRSRPSRSASTTPARTVSPASSTRTSPGTEACPHSPPGRACPSPPGMCRRRWPRRTSSRSTRPPSRRRRPGSASTTRAAASCARPPRSRPWTRNCCRSRAARSGFPTGSGSTPRSPARTARPGSSTPREFVEVDPGADPAAPPRRRGPLRPPA